MTRKNDTNDPQDCYGNYFSGFCLDHLVDHGIYWRIGPVGWQDTLLSNCFFYPSLACRLALPGQAGEKARQ